MAYISFEAELVVAMSPLLGKDSADRPIRTFKWLL